MTDLAISGAQATDAATAAKARIRARYRAETRFKLYGISAIAITAIFLVVVLGDIVQRGLPAFVQHSLTIDVLLDREDIDPQGSNDPATIRGGDFQLAAVKALRAQFPDATDRAARRRLDGLLSSGAADRMREDVVANPSLVGKTVREPLLFSDDVDLYFKGVGTKIIRIPGQGALSLSGTSGDVTITAPSDNFRTVRFGPREASALVAVNGGVVKLTELNATGATGQVLIAPKSADATAGQWQFMSYVTPEGDRRVTDREVAWLEALRERGAVSSAFNWSFFTSGDSREPELAGIRGALIGSLLTLLVTLGLCLPLGVGAAVYLEEFAPKNRLTELIEININNLAAVPSIVFGLLGLAVFLNFFDLPRSAPIVGGLVLALLVLPTIIIASRAALKAVPPSIKEAALGVGASHQQAVFHHVLPPAIPGIMTGTIIGMAHALGETAPLLMIGMVAFIVEVPQSFAQAATVLPVQIYLWSDLPEIAFQAKTAAAIMVLLGFLFVMNGAAIVLRRRFERRW